jgi:hypothetical protein
MYFLIFHDVFVAGCIPRGRRRTGTVWWVVDVFRVRHRKLFVLHYFWRRYGKMQQFPCPHQASQASIELQKKKNLSGEASRHFRFFWPDLRAVLFISVLSYLYTSLTMDPFPLRLVDHNNRVGSVRLLVGSCSWHKRNGRLPLGRSQGRWHCS